MTQNSVMILSATGITNHGSQSEKEEAISYYMIG